MTPCVMLYSRRLEKSVNAFNVFMFRSRFVIKEGNSLQRISISFVTVYIRAWHDGPVPNPAAESDQRVVSMRKTRNLKLQIYKLRNVSAILGTRFEELKASF